MTEIMRTCFFFKLNKYLSPTQSTNHKSNFLIYKIIKNYYNVHLKRKNLHIRILDQINFCNLFMESNSLVSGLSNLFLKKWFFLKV